MEEIQQAITSHTQRLNIAEEWLNTHPDVPNRPPPLPHGSKAHKDDDDNSDESFVARFKQACASPHPDDINPFGCLADCHDGESGSDDDYDRDYSDNEEEEESPKDKYLKEREFRQKRLEAQQIMPQEVEEHVKRTPVTHPRPAQNISLKTSLRREIEENETWLAAPMNPIDKSKLTKEEEEMTFMKQAIADLREKVHILEEEEPEEEFEEADPILLEDRHTGRISRPGWLAENQEIVRVMNAIPFYLPIMRSEQGWCNADQLEAFREGFQIPKAEWKGRIISFNFEDQMRVVFWVWIYQKQLRIYHTQDIDRRLASFGENLRAAYRLICNAATTNWFQDYSFMREVHTLIPHTWAISTNWIERNTDIFLQGWTQALPKFEL